MTDKETINYSPEFSFLIENWYKNNCRDLPWRNTENSYIIWISEIILQQTRVNQGLDYFTRFVERFPDAASLALAEEDEVMKYWQGLGYYSRARNLHAAAKQIMETYNGEFPTEYEDVIKLKGVGEYTAAAICSFAYNLPYAVLDGNVYRVLSRVYGMETPINTPKGKREFSDVAQSLLDRKNPALYNQAIMEFGALQCSPMSPNCEACVLNKMCIAYFEKKVNVLPIKIKNTKVKERFFNYVFIKNGDFTYIRKRSGNDIWKNLYEFPLIETEKQIEIHELLNNPDFKKIFSSVSAGIEDIESEKTKKYRHILTHRIINAAFYTIHINNKKIDFDNYIEINLNDIQDYPVSRLMEMFINTNFI